MLNNQEEKRINAIIYLLECLKGSQVGKKSIQKLIYFLQEEFGVDLNYRYKMYHYGPYCSELSDDLDIMDMMGTISIQDAPAMNGYTISTKYEIKADIDAQQFLESHKQKFDRLIEYFKERSAKVLELYATIHFVERVLRERGQESDKDCIVQKVKIMKPKYSDDDIKKAYDYLLDKSLIGQRN